VKHRLEQEEKGSKTSSNDPLIFVTHHYYTSGEKLKRHPYLANLVVLHKDFDGELWGQHPVGDQLVQRSGEAVADGGPPVQFDGAHLPLQHRRAASNIHISEHK
jgi:hypothetical protein